LKPIEQLAELIRERNELATRISAVIQRPCQIGHLGEFIAAAVFNIALEESATAKAIDGRFLDGPFAGKTVNIKWYAKRENLLDITPETLPDYYLVLAGPKSPATNSRGEVRPWLIDSVHLFEADALVTSLEERGVKIGVATSVRQTAWEQNEVYPRRADDIMHVSDEQRRILKLFGTALP
jgi:hypothetical protein